MSKRLRYHDSTPVRHAVATGGLRSLAGSLDHTRELLAAGMRVRAAVLAYVARGGVIGRLPDELALRPRTAEPRHAHQNCWSEDCDILEDLDKHLAEPLAALKGDE